MIKHKNLWITAFIVPTLFVFAAIFAVPMVIVVITSFCDYTAFQAPVFAGIKNYQALLFHNEVFGIAIRNTVFWVLLQTTVNVFIGVGVALLLRRRPIGWKFVRTCYMIPNIIPTAATGLMFTLMYNPMMGVVQGICSSMGVETPNLFGNSDYTFWAVTSVWIFYSALNTIIVLSEIGSISPELFEAARIDGANTWQEDRYITLPILKNVIGTCTILQAVGMVSQFDVIYMTTKGGPGSATMNLPVYLFKTANLEMNYGMANTIGVVQIALGLLLVFLINRIFNIGRQKG